MPEINSNIKCSVKDCRHHDSTNYCKLTNISIGGECTCTDCKETECRSFATK